MNNTSCCSDFYLHVNEKWLNDPINQIPDDYPKWGGFTKLHDQGIKNQIQLVKELIDSDGLTDEQFKITEIWKASMKRFNDWNENRVINYDPLISELKILDEFLPLNQDQDQDQHNNVAKYLHYTQINGIQNVFDFDKGQNLKQSDQVVLDISTCGLSLPSREYYTDDNFREKRELFTKHLVAVKHLVDTCIQNNPETKTKYLNETFVQDVIEFESMVANYKMKKEQSRRYNEYYTNTTLSDLHKNINTLNSVTGKQDNYQEEEKDYQIPDNKMQTVSDFFEKVYELFDFRRIMKENKIKSWTKDQESCPNDEHITAFDGDAIRRIVSLILDPLNYSKYRSFLQYKIICSSESYCTKELNDLFFDFYQRELGGQLVPKPDDKRTMSLINQWVGEMMGKIYVAKYFPESHKNDIKSMVGEILKTMNQSIISNDWLTQGTKEKALEKLSKFNLKIGYPDKWMDYSELYINESDSLYTISKAVRVWYLKVKFFDLLNTKQDRDEWLMTPQTVNAYFMPTQNEIVFPAAILQPPFYCKDQNDIEPDIEDEKRMVGDNYDFRDAINFGGIGAVIAHEITHGYDDSGRKFDGDGNLNDWWTTEDQELFKQKTNIMAKQASEYVFIDSEKTYKINPELTMGENLADLGGLSLGLSALTRRLKEVNTTYEEIVANQRVFFKSFANIWKQNTKKDCMINNLTTDPHSPPDFRANLVKNIKEFYQVFGVNDNDKMWIPDDSRVRMW